MLANYNRPRRMCGMATIAILLAVAAIASGLLFLGGRNSASTSAIPSGVIGGDRLVAFDVLPRNCHAALS